VEKWMLRFSAHDDIDKSNDLAFTTATTKSNMAGRDFDLP
jgi:hypothetical protein